MAGEWLAQVPEDLRGHESLTSYATLGDFVKGHIDTVGKVSELDGKVKDSDGKVTDLTKRLENAVTIPGDSATDEERKAFFQRIGVPDKAEGYEFDKDDIDAQADKMFRELMLKSSIPKASAKSVRKAFADMLTQGKATQEKARQEAEATEAKATEDAVNALKDVWKGDTFKANTELAKRAFAKVLEWAGVNEADGKKFIEETKIGSLSVGDNPFLLRIFHAIATKIGDDSITGPRGGGAGGPVSDEEAAKRRFPNTKWTT